MQFITTALLALGVVAAAAPATSDTTSTAAAKKTYYLKTQVKSGQTGKSAYNNLYLTAYHSGAGENDAVLLPNKTVAAPGKLERVNTTASGKPVYNQVFTLGEYEYSLIPLPNEDFYAAWQPTVINIGNYTDTNETSFYLNKTGLQWTTAAGTSNNGEFDGWLACDWFRSVPQLFFLITGEDSGAKIPSSCAKVNLVPEYI